jgi:hypothetical protein
LSLKKSRIWQYLNFEEKCPAAGHLPEKEQLAIWEEVQGRVKVKVHMEPAAFNDLTDDGLIKRCVQLLKVTNRLGSQLVHHAKARGDCVRAMKGRGLDWSRLGIAEAEFDAMVMVADKMRQLPLEQLGTMMLLSLLRTMENEKAMAEMRRAPHRRV